MTRLASLSLLVVLCGCPTPSGTDGGGATGGSGGAAGGGGGAAAKPIEEGCAAITRAECDFAFSCPARTFRQTQGEFPFKTVAECYAATALLTRCVQDYSRPGTTYTKVELEACAVKTRAQACGVPTPSCFPSKAGTKADGANCAQGDECVSGACTRATSTTCGTCIASAMPGKGCVASTDCASLLNNLSCVGMQCTADVELGGACTAPSDNGPYCKIGLVCDGTGTCKDPATLPGDAEACVAQVGCRPGFACEADLCTPFSAFGAADDCSSGAASKYCPPGQACLSTKRCTATTMVADGAACSAFNNGTVCGAASTCSGLNPTCGPIAAPMICN